MLLYVVVVVPTLITSIYLASWSKSWCLAYMYLAWTRPGQAYVDHSALGRYKRHITVYLELHNTDDLWLVGSREKDDFHSITSVTKTLHLGESLRPLVGGLGANLISMVPANLYVLRLYGLSELRNTLVHMHMQAYRGTRLGSKF
jgi:hypothetical protein